MAHAADEALPRRGCSHIFKVHYVTRLRGPCYYRDASSPRQRLLLLLLIHTFSVLSLQLKKLGVTQQVSHGLIICQSRLWSRRCTKVNESHRGDNPLLRPTGIQIATKNYATLQAMAPTDIKTVHKTSLLHIESSLDRLGLLSPTHDQRSQQQSGQMTLQPVRTTGTFRELLDDDG